MRHSFFLVPWACLLLWPASKLPAGATDVIISGSGGVEEYRDRFRDWSSRLYRLLIEDLGRDRGDVLLFQEAPLAEGAPGRAVNLENLRAAFRELAANHSQDEDLFLYLIGHGSYLQETSRFQIPGRDLTAVQLAELLDAIPARRVVLIQAASASAGFINVLSKKGRIICSATKTVAEQNATEFMELFLQGLEDGGADRNRDERISVWEACELAASLTESWYLGEGLIPTEHAILDDNGDGLGTRLFLADADPAIRLGRGGDAIDGELARSCYLKDFVFPAGVPRDWVDRYLALIEDVEKLKARKSSLGESQYYEQLETRLVEAARLHRRIRNQAGREEKN